MSTVLVVLYTKCIAVMDLILSMKVQVGVLLVPQAAIAHMMIVWILLRRPKFLAEKDSLAD